MMFGSTSRHRLRVVVGLIGSGSVGLALWKQRQTDFVECDSKPVENGERLRSWQGTSWDDARDFRRHPGDIDKDRHVVLLLGVTGAGKSSTANTLVGKSRQTFKESDSVVSETSSVTFRDYSFMDLDWRVIDSPGLSDTNVRHDQTVKELEHLTRYAKHGISCFLIVIPFTRLTAENVLVVESIIKLFGPDVVNHMVMGVTKCKKMTRQKLIDDINKLPMDNYLRQLVERLNYRIVPVENKIQDKRYLSRLQLHQRFLDVMDTTNGETFDLEGFHDRVLAGENVEFHEQMLEEVMSLRKGNCKQRWTKRADKYMLDLHCEFDIATK